MGYAEAFDIQERTHREVLDNRGLDNRGKDVSSPGVLLLVEHPPVVTVSRRASAKEHLLATPELLRSRGVEVADTDRGGDITYHGPGQLVAYPILDLNRLGLGLHGYMRLLEECVIRTIAAFGLAGVRDSTATGVWVESGVASSPVPGRAKIAAMGVRVRRWVSMHGLALNVDPDMDHFGLIVPCGLVGRPVTSMAMELGGSCPTMADVKSCIAGVMESLVSERVAV